MEKTPIRKVSRVQDRTPGAAGGDLPETTFMCHFGSGEALVLCQLGLSVGQWAVGSICQAP